MNPMQGVLQFYRQWLAGPLAALLIVQVACAQDANTRQRLDDLLDELAPPSVAQLVDLLGDVPPLEELLEPMAPDFVPLQERTLDNDAQAASDELLQLLNEQDNPAQALEAAQELAELLDAELGAEHPRTAAARSQALAMNAMAELSAADLEELEHARDSLADVVPAYRAGKLSEALAIVVQHACVEHEILGSNGTFSKSLATSTKLLHSLGDYTRAERTARAGLQRACAESGIYNRNVTSSLGNLATLATMLRRLDEAEVLHAHSLAVRRELYGDRGGEYALALLQLAGLYRLRNDTEQGSQVVDRAIAILESTGTYKAYLGALLLERGVLDWSAGNDLLAQVNLERAVQVLAKAHAGDHQELVKAMGTLADVERGLGHYERARGLAEESLAMIDRLHPKGHPETARTRHRLALCQEVMGDLEAAEQSYRFAISAMTAQSSRPSEDLSSALVGLTGLLARKGDRAGAQDASERALAEQRRALGRTRQLAYALMTAADRQQAAGEWNAARASIEEALQIYTRELVAGHPRIAHSQVALAEVLVEYGEMQAAQELLAPALASDSSLVRASARQVAAKVAYAQGDLARAAQFAAESLELRQGLFVAPHPELVEALVLRAQIARAAGELGPAGRTYSAALEQANSLRTRIVGDERDRALYARQLSLGAIARALALVHLAEGHATSAFEAAEQGRGRALLDLLQRSGHNLIAAARKRNPEQAQVLEERLATRAMARQKLLFNEQRLRSAASRSGTSEQELADLESSLRAARRTLMASEGELEASLRPVWPTASPLSAAAIANKFGANEGLLHYTWDEHGIGLVALRGGNAGGWIGRVLASDAQDAATLQNAVLDLLRSIRSGDAIDEQLQSTVSARLIPDEVWEHLAGCERVVVVPDGVLHELPFDCLLAPGGRWLEHGPQIAYSSSAALHAHGRVKRAKPHDEPPAAIVLGNPAFAASGEEQDTSIHSRAASRSELDGVRLFGDQLAALPGTEAEARQIARTLSASGWKVETLIGPEARVAGLRSASASAQVVHIATHGFAARAAYPYDSALALATPDEVSEQDDGFLTLDDLVSRWGGHLKACDLVVLSACDTQVGTTLGESRVALPWGFFFAGADSALVSLWKVDDRATVLLMDRFYTNYAGAFETDRVVAGRRFAAGQRMPESAALQEAKAWLAVATPEQNRARLLEFGLEATDPANRGQFPRPGARPASRPTVANDDFRAARFGSAFVLYGQHD